jgi:hypothetical protein
LIEVEREKEQEGERERERGWGTSADRGERNNFAFLVHFEATTYVPRQSGNKIRENIRDA